MNDILSHCEKQIVLYTKGHFTKKDLIEDLRAIVAESFAIPIESTYFYHIYNHVTRIFLKLHEAEYITESMEDFLCGLFKWNRVLKPEDMINEMLGKISIVKAAGLNLGEADGKYLPIKHREITAYKN